MTQKQREIWDFLFEFESSCTKETNKIEDFLSFLQEKGVNKSRTAIYNLLNRSLYCNLPYEKAKKYKERKKRYPTLMIPLFQFHEKEEKYA